MSGKPCINTYDSKKRMGLTDVVIIAFFTLMCLTMILPFWDTLVKSISTETENLTLTFRLFPKALSFDGYIGILSQAKLVRAFIINVYVTIVGTILHVFFCSMTGYALGTNDFWGKRFVINLLVIAMILPGQVMMIPSFVLYRSLNLLNNVNVMVISGMITSFSVLLFRNFYISIPKALHDAAKIDGAGEFRIFAQVYFPMSKAGLATVMIFQIIGKWNIFFEGVMYINDGSKQPLQVVLSEILSSFVQNNAPASIAAGPKLGMNLQAAAVIIAIVPMILVYPVLQKHFIKGALLGAIKE